MNICAIVPSLNPDEKLLDVVKGLRDKNYRHIILVNDGSEKSDYFDMLAGEDCTVLTHEVNKGKGRALKTAFEYYLEHYSDECAGVVLCDGDNQHTPDDIYRCAEVLTEDNTKLVLGVRDFNEKNVPPRSRFGNKMTSFMFRILAGLTITDTQTGLRAIGNDGVREFLKVKGERFEYETNMLLETKRLGMDIREVTIQTIYIEENKTSHFRPIRDSWSIYKILFKFAWASIASCLIDLGIFQLMIMLLSFMGEKQMIFAATATARVVSSVFNYIMNYKKVFRSREGIAKTAVKYYILAILQAFASYYAVYLLSSMAGWNPLVAKLVVDGILFLVGFQVQRDIVFNTKKK